jgi:hypothetical protein
MSIPSNNSQQQPANVERPDMTAVFAQLKEKVPEKATEGDLESRTVTVIQAKKPEQLHKSDMGAGAADMEAQAVFQKIKETASQPLPEPNRFARWVVSMGERSPIKKLFLSVFSGLRTLNTETNKIKGAQSQAVEENKLILKEAQEHVFELNEGGTTTEFHIEGLSEKFKRTDVDKIPLEKITSAISNRERMLGQIKERKAKVEDTRDNIIAKGVSNTDDTKVGLNSVISNHDKLIGILEEQITALGVRSVVESTEEGANKSIKEILVDADKAVQNVRDLDDISNPNAFETPIKKAFGLLTGAINLLTGAITLSKRDHEQRGVQSKDFKTEGLQKIKTELEAKKIELEAKQAILKFTAANKELIENVHREDSSFLSNKTRENAESFFRTASETISKLDADIGALGGASDPRTKELMQLKSELEAKLPAAVGIFSGDLKIVLKDDSGSIRLHEDFGKFDGVFNRKVFVAQYDAQLKAYSEADANPIEINNFKYLALPWTFGLKIFRPLKHLKMCKQTRRCFLKLTGQSKYPTVGNLASTIGLKDPAKQAQIVEQMNSVRPVVTQKTIEVAERFLEDKRANGSETEKALYKEMTTEQFMNRLLLKRHLQFMTSRDSYITRTGQHGSGIGAMQTLASPDISKVSSNGIPLNLEDNLSYDELEISALISVSTPSFLINDGNRFNRGVPGAEGTFQQGEVIIQGGSRGSYGETRRYGMEILCYYRKSKYPR